MIDWSLLLAAIINMSKEHSLSMGLTVDHHKPAPSKWTVKHAYGKKEPEKNPYVHRRKRDILDDAGRIVAENLDIPTADYLSLVTPEAIMVLMDSIDELTQIIANERNEGLLHPVHDPEQIRLYILKKHQSEVAAFLKRQNDLIIRRNERARMAPPESKGKHGGIRAPRDKFQEKLDQRKDIIALANKEQMEYERQCRARKLEQSIRASKGQSQSRKAASTSRTGKRPSSGTGRSRYWT
jgi:hypothetical protein